eukprot:CAMPEP_0171481244 /NCGR_PEP_ID=MMETSP0946-20130122/6615_1 /TAXON_ID=109269 /ORGANISM="Vaucheria litorea, Strain CCMP2940" /LENGTH=46 /DNA_ID= /DNA_START= /DNA_END= /DNA_ORIENTATION=
MALARLELMALDSAWTSSKLVRMVKQRQQKQRRPGIAVSSEDMHVA